MKPGRPPATRLGKILRPLVTVAAILYFIIDALFLSLVRPLGRLIAELRIYDWLRQQLDRLGPYPTLVFFVVPYILLEPVKPVALYLIAIGHIVNGILVLVIGEFLKLLIVERLFHLTRDKLMTIPAFAWTYNRVMAWLGYLRSLPAWQAIERRMRAIKEQAREYALAVRAQWRQLVRSE